MWSLFSKKEEFKIVAPVTGELINIEEVKDEVFSKKMMGDGFAIIPNDTTIVSPVSGKIEMVFPTQHAIGLVNKDGLEVMVHVGIDTCGLNGKGLKALVKKGDKVKQGQKLINIDDELLANKSVDLTTMVVFTNSEDIKVNLEKRDVVMGEGLI